MELSANGPAPEISFRPWTLQDTGRLALLADDADVARNLRDGFPHPYTERDAGNFISMCLLHQTPCNFAVIWGGEVAGGIGYVPGHDVHRLSAEIGYWLGKRYWGRGIASRAVRDFSRYVFGSTGIIHLHAGVFSTNRASARVLEKAGYSFVGSMHRCAVKGGDIIGLDYYELCKPSGEK